MARVGPLATPHEGWWPMRLALSDDSDSDRLLADRADLVQGTLAWTNNAPSSWTGDIRGPESP